MFRRAGRGERHRPIGERSLPAVLRMRGGRLGFVPCFGCSREENIRARFSLVPTAVESHVDNIPTLLTSFAEFDGSEIGQNAVVVSNAFWGKFIYLLVGQLLGSLAFTILVAFISAQGKLIVDQVVTKAADNDTKSGQSTFRRLDDPPRPPLDVGKLLLCLLIDVLGASNEVVPVVGEVVDVLYAPFAALLLRQLFAGSNVVFLLELTEEILPFTDIIPLATICWIIESFFADSSLAKSLGIGQFSVERADEVADETQTKGLREEPAYRQSGLVDAIDVEIETKPMADKDVKS